MFERVYTMTEYYDGPRSGLADLGGRPHAETLRLALEHWEIWLAPILPARLDALPGPAIRARGVFRPSPGYDHGGRGLEVQWTRG